MGTVSLVAWYMSVTWYDVPFMDTQAILANLRIERDRLSQAIAALEALSGSKPGKPRGRKPRRHMSAEARAKIAAGMRRRWAAKKRTS